MSSQVKLPELRQAWEVVSNLGASRITLWNEVTSTALGHYYCTKIVTKIRYDNFYCRVYTLSQNPVYIWSKNLLVLLLWPILLLNCQYLNNLICSSYHTTSNGFEIYQKQSKHSNQYVIYGSSLGTQTNTSYTAYS